MTVQLTREQIEGINQQARVNALAAVMREGSDYESYEQKIREESARLTAAIIKKQEQNDAV